MDGGGEGGDALSCPSKFWRVTNFIPLFCLICKSIFFQIFLFLLIKPALCFKHAYYCDCFHSVGRFSIWLLFIFSFHRNCCQKMSKMFKVQIYTLIQLGAQLITEHIRTNIRQFTIVFQGPKLWNSLPVHFRLTSSSYNVFSRFNA